MSNDYTVLNAGSGGDNMDESGLVYASAPTTRKRPRVVMGDDNIADAFAKIGPFGTLSVSNIIKLAGGTFDTAALDATIWTETTGVTGSSSLSGGIITLNPGLLSTGRVLETTVKSGRFLSSSPNLFLGRFAFGDTGQTNNIRRIGCFSATDGFFFELNGTTPRLVTRKASSDTAITSFNGTSGAWTIDTDFHNYEVRVTLGKLSFFVDGAWVHTALFPATTWAATPTLPVAFETVNGALVTTGTPTLKCSVVAISRFGDHTGRPSYKNIAGASTTVLKSGPGTLNRVIVNANLGTSAVIYDNTAGSGTKIATLNLNSMVTLAYDLDFITGLTIVTTGSTCDITVVWD